MRRTSTPSDYHADDDLWGKCRNWSVPTVKGQREREVFLLNDAIRRVEGLPPVLSSEKIKVDKKEKGQATLGNFFAPNGVSSSSPGKGKRKAGETTESALAPGSAKKAKAEDNRGKGKDGVKEKDMAK